MLTRIRRRLASWIYTPPADPEPLAFVTNRELADMIASRNDVALILYGRFRSEDSDKIMLHGSCKGGLHNGRLMLETGREMLERSEVD